MRTPAARLRMVAEQLRARGVADERVLGAMAEVPREEFVPEQLRRLAYEDSALAIGCDQTISQPLVVASMIQALQLRGDERVLEVGGGSGYLSAVVSRLAVEVVVMEVVEELALRARSTLARLGYANVTVLAGDGKQGWRERAPYRGIVVSCAGESVPPALLEQLAPDGRLVMPVGREGGVQVVRVFGPGQERRDLFPARFVPLR